MASPSSANDSTFLDDLTRPEPDVFVVADYGEMLRQRFRSTPRLGAFNLHASLLPRHRGAAPVVHSILAGDRITGVTLFRIERELDAGPILDAVEVAILPTETAGALEARLAQAAADLLERNLVRFLEGDLDLEPQDSARATLAPKLTKDQGAIDWAAGAATVARHVRAMDPWPGAYSFLRRRSGALERVRVLEARAASSDSPSAGATAASPGAIVDVTEKSLRIACGDGILEVLQVQRPGKSALAVETALRGWRLEAGDRFESVAQV